MSPTQEDCEPSCENENKSDRVDAQYLARIGRLDPTLLYPLRHRSPETRADLAVLRSRAALVRTRGILVNHVRGVVKSAGSRLPRCEARLPRPWTEGGRFLRRMEPKTETEALSTASRGAAMKITLEIADADLRHIGYFVSEAKTHQSAFIDKASVAGHPEPLLVSVKKAAEMLSISRSQCYELVRAGTIPAVRLGRSIRVSYAGLQEFISRLEEQGMEE